MVAVESLVGVQLESETKIKKMKFEFLKNFRVCKTFTDIFVFQRDGRINFCRG